MEYSDILDLQVDRWILLAFISCCYSKCLVEELKSWRQTEYAGPNGHIILLMPAICLSVRAIEIKRYMRLELIPVNSEMIQSSKEGHPQSTTINELELAHVLWEAIVLCFLVSLLSPENSSVNNLEDRSRNS